ncbi:hypothetical protein U9M48_018545 [Paspalum notatum var. saurae]|uniref:Protein kinase domain-containing protein n=1 Tax=Paspalum notatum var. saurae TaxID=547442 RepID=A0AAQ3WQM1_PASNO
MGSLFQDLSKLRTGAKKAISIVALLWFLIFLGFFVIRGRATGYSSEHGWEYYHKDEAIAFEIVTYVAIACLYILAPSRLAEKLVSVVFLGALFLIVLFASISNGAIKLELVFAANIVALSLYCIWKLYSIVLPLLHDYWIREVHLIAQPWLQYLLAIAPAWEEDEEGTTGHIQDLPRELVRAMTKDFQSMVGEGATNMADLEDPPRPGSIFLQAGCFDKDQSPRAKKAILHASIVAFLWFHIFFGFFVIHQRRWYSYGWRGGDWVDSNYDGAVAFEIVTYGAIACLYILAPSRRTEKLVSVVFLGTLFLIVLFVSISNEGIKLEFVFAANIVALSLYCIWKLYPVVLPWLHDYWIREVYPVAQPWLQYLPAISPAWEEEETATERLLPRHQTAAAFRIQDLPREFSYGEVRAMTQDFRTMVGEGGFAQVFRGLLDDGSTAVAVKRITVTGDGAVGGEDDFLREISIVANVHHRSLVRLLGYCLPRRAGGSSRYLVYPFFENGSLDSWLFHGGDERRRLLPWPARRCIAVDVAKALAYLHHECRQQILHLDIKPGNILLDADLRAYVSDFGISMSVTRDLSWVDTRGRGTPGYMAPEMMINALSTKSDVFSYGMTLLELVGGRRNFDPPSSTNDSSATPDLARDFFPYVVREKMARGELMEAVDSAMTLVDQEEVEAVVKVALCCIESRWDMRPSMLTVVDMLEGRVAADLPSESRRLMSSVNFSGPLSLYLTHGRAQHSRALCGLLCSLGVGYY